MAKLSDQHVLVAYVDGSDLHDVASLLRSEFQQFIESQHWRTNQVVFVDQVHDPDPDFPDFLPDWDLGINLGLDHILRADGWFGDVEALIRFLERLHAVAGRDFVVFMAFRSRIWLQEHLCFVEGKPIDLNWLREAIERLVSS